MQAGNWSKDSQKFEREGCFPRASLTRGLIMSDTVQIICIAAIVLILMFALAVIIDNPDKKQFRNQLLTWLYVTAIMIYKVIF